MVMTRWGDALRGGGVVSAQHTGGGVKELCRSEASRGDDHWSAEPGESRAVPGYCMQRDGKECMPCANAYFGCNPAGSFRVRVNCGRDMQALACARPCKGVAETPVVLMHLQIHDWRSALVSKPGVVTVDECWSKTSRLCLPEISKG